MPFHHAVLDNGLHVVAELSDASRSVAAGFFVRAGSRDEAPEVAGVSHFLEHMAFKGGAKRDALTINRDFDRFGAKNNAQTSEEETIFFAASLPEYLPKTFDVLAELMRPRLEAGDFETEKEVIIEEIRMYLDNPMMTAYEEAKAAHFGRHPLGQSILGSVESIGAMTAEQMRAYHERRYGPSNIVLAFCGRSDWDDLLKLAREQCGAWTGPGADRALAPTKGARAFRSLLRKEDQQQIFVGIADAPPLEDDLRYAAGLLTTILGDHTGSRFYWALIDPGLADSADVSYQEYNQAGAFLTFLSCEPEQAEENMATILEVYREAMASGVSPDELERAKNKVMSRMVLRGERPMGRLMSLGYNWMYRRKYLSVQDELDAYSRVTAGDIAEVLRRWPLDALTIATAGPNGEVKAPA